MGESVPGKTFDWIFSSKFPRLSLLLSPTLCVRGGPGCHSPFVPLSCPPMCCSASLSEETLGSQMSWGSQISLDGRHKVLEHLLPLLTLPQRLPCPGYSGGPWPPIRFLTVLFQASTRPSRSSVPSHPQTPMHGCIYKYTLC